MKPLTYIRAAIQGGGRLTLKSPFVGKSIFLARMDWDGERPVIGTISMVPEEAIENLEGALKRHAEDEAAAGRA